MKRKSEAENPTTTDGSEIAAGVDSSKNKRRRLRNENSFSAAKASKKSKKDRKVKTDAVEVEEEPDEMVEDAEDDSKDVEMLNAKTITTTPAVTEEAKANKSSRKKDKKSKKKASSSSKQTEDEAAATTTAAPNINTNDAAESQKGNRWIVFVGNLPYSATVADIERHFQAISPTAVRLLHQKHDRTKSRGVAFVEFAGYDHMKTCLKTMHHSTIKCHVYVKGRSQIEERQINVELTAGGGGNTENRKEKIRAKNEKLNEERERRAVAELLQQAKKDQGNEKKGEKQKTDQNEGIHPSRLSRVLNASS